MAKLVKEVNGHKIFELDYNECKKFGRCYPTFCTWYDEEEIGNMDMTENEDGTITEMEKWCKKY